MLEGVIGNGHEGDIAVDDWAVLSGNCQSVIKQGSYVLFSVYNPFFNSFILTGTVHFDRKLYYFPESLGCNFNVDMCGWAGHPDWILNEGEYRFHSI